MEQNRPVFLFIKCLKLEICGLDAWQLMLYLAKHCSKFVESLLRYSYIANFEVNLRNLYVCVLFILKSMNN